MTGCAMAEPANDLRVRRKGRVSDDGEGRLLLGGSESPLRLAHPSIGTIAKSPMRSCGSAVP
jgi:hypothetical protein